MKGSNSTYNDNEVRDPAFIVSNIDVETGETTLIIKKGILGAVANQLKNTNKDKKCSTILRKLGYVLADCGDIQYSESSHNSKII